MLCKGSEGHLGNLRMTKWVPDEALMLQVREGASESLGVLFDRYQKPLFNFYSKMTGNRTVSEDLVQEVFLRVLKYRQSYKPGTPFRAWIYQIARNARLDQLRKQRPETESSDAREGFTLPGDLGATAAGKFLALSGAAAIARGEKRSVGDEPVSRLEI